MKPVALFGLAVLLGLASCQQPTDKAGDVRVSLDSDRQTAVSAKVWVEGADGSFLSGALVDLVGPGGELAILGFDPTRGAFTGQLDTLASGTFHVLVRSKGLSQERNLDVPHQRLSDTPSLTAVADTAGSDALSGQTLSKALPIALAWNPVAGATVYGVVVVKGFQVLYSTQTTQTACLIPASSLPTGNLTLQVTASYQAGDPYFRTQAWSSSSQSVGSSVTLALGN